MINDERDFFLSWGLCISCSVASINGLKSGKYFSTFSSTVLNLLVLLYSFSGNGIHFLISGSMYLYPCTHYSCPDQTKILIGYVLCIVLVQKKHKKSVFYCMFEVSTSCTYWSYSSLLSFRETIYLVLWISGFNFIEN